MDEFRGCVVMAFKIPKGIERTEMAPWSWEVVSLPRDLPFNRQKGSGLTPLPGKLSIFSF
jgi:hypothetical protein